MNKQKTALAILVLLIAIKFVFLPWSEWVTESQSATARLNQFDIKQQQVIENELLISENLIKHQQNLSSFVESLPAIKSGDKANTLWFALIDTIKTEDIKVYNQRVEFEEYVTENVGYVTGKFYMSGKGRDVLQAVLTLEAKAPYVFLEQLRLIRSQGKEKETMVIELYLRYWFTTTDKNTK